ARPRPAAGEEAPQHLLGRGREEGQGAGQAGRPPGRGRHPRAPAGQRLRLPGQHDHRPARGHGGAGTPRRGDDGGRQGGHHPHQGARGRLQARQGTRELARERHRGVLEDLHARGLPGGPVRADHAPHPVPVPPVHLRRHGRGEGRLRAGGPAAAAVAAVGRGRLPHRDGRLPRARRTELLGARMSQTTAPKAVEGTLGFIDERLGSTSFFRRNVKKVFPDPWSFLLGEIALYSVVILLLTGTFLTFWFKPGMTEVVYDGSYTNLQGVAMSEAYASTLHISFDVRGGLLMRQIHHWSAILFMASLVAHMLRVFFTGAYRKPRELNWLIGLGMFTLGIVEGLFGYSLPDDLLSGTGLRITQGVAESIPVVGTYLYMFLFGGEFPGQDIIPRLYMLHILLIPALLLGLITAHMMIMWHQKH